MDQVKSPGMFCVSVFLLMIPVTVGLISMLVVLVLLHGSGLRSLHSGLFSHGWGKVFTR